jgi:hypothetical protein
MELEIKMMALEFRWREADDLSRAARAELVAQQKPSRSVAEAIRKQIVRAEEMKQKILRQIVALEDEMDLSP